MLPLFFHLFCSLVREIRQLKEQVALGNAATDSSAGSGGKGEVAAVDAETQLAREQLANILLGLAVSVSLLHERRHESLLSQVLGIQLWTMPQVKQRRLIWPTDFDSSLLNGFHWVHLPRGCA